MSAQTTSNNVQDIIESRVEKRTKGVYVPLGGKKLLTFMDDFNMPAKDTFGSQPPLELIKVGDRYYPLGARSVIGTTPVNSSIGTKPTQS